MKIRNVSPYGELDVPLLHRLVDYCEVVDVSPEHASVLLAQFDAWAPADAAAQKVAAQCVDEQQQRDRDARGEPDTSALKPQWVTFAQSTGGDPSGMTKAQIVEAFGTLQFEPVDVAATLAERGDQLADGRAVPEPPPGDPGGGDGGSEDNQGGDN